MIGLLSVQTDYLLRCARLSTVTVVDLGWSVLYKVDSMLRNTTET